MSALSVLAVAALVLYIAIAAILVWQYLRTREAGFLWLGVAVIIWPVISRLLDGVEKAFIDRIGHHQSVFFPFTLVASGRITTGRLVESLAVFEQIAGICLLLIAVLSLCRAKNRPYAR